MPVLKFEDENGVFHPLGILAKGEKGEKGDPGDKGDPGNVGPLDSLTDVSGTTGAVAGKVLGTTADGAWGPVDHNDLSELDARYLLLTGGALTGALHVEGNLTGTWLYSQYGADFGSARVTSVGDPVDSTDAVNKGYVDSRIWKGTQAQYDAVAPGEPGVLYVILPG